MSAFLRGMCRVFSFGMMRSRRPPVRSVEHEVAAAFAELDRVTDAATTRPDDPRR